MNLQPQKVKWMVTISGKHRTILLAENSRKHMPEENMALSRVDKQGLVGHERTTERQTRGTLGLVTATSRPAYILSLAMHSSCSPREKTPNT